jgi:hypothetical protein
LLSREYLRLLTANKHAISRITKTNALDGRLFNIALSHFCRCIANVNLATSMATGIIQAEHSIKIEPHMDLDYMGEAFLHMGQPPLKSNILFMSIMITNTPFISKG